MENIISYVKEPSQFSILESKLWYNRTEMVEFIKTCDQYPCKFNFSHFSDP